jgi:hypothetical protein
LSLAACQTQPVSQRATAGFSQPVLLPIKYEGKERYQSVRDWTFETEKVPSGIVVDGASVPRIAWIFMPPDGLQRAAALGHDYFYIHRGVMPSGRVVTREEADFFFLEYMLKGGVSPRRASIAYNAVRGFGWREWNRPYKGPVILPVQQPVLAKRVQKPTFLTRHLYE